jgi:acetyl/propionyl-CoA carboxylase alpha subunit
MIRKVLIANRGEIACRIMRSCKSLGLATVAVHSAVDVDALHVASADEAVLIEAPKPVASYLDIDAILAAAKATGADAVHPGYGFLAENEAFAAAVEAAGLVWVGPRPDAMMAMADKARARELATRAGVPVLPGSQRFAEGTLDSIEAAAEAVGLPLLVKASGGGGGIGMRLVENLDSVRQVAEATQGLAARAFGDGSIFLERYVRNARHVEVQVFGFGDGRVLHLFERECSIQRRFQKILEESPSPGISPATRARMTAAAVALAEAVNYRSAGTVEFVVDADTEEFFFLEMNTRIQVEHPVTEAVTGLDLVAMQLRLAAGDPSLNDLTQDEVKLAGHAIELRIYAENPARMFLPSPGRLAHLRFPEALEGVRIDTGVREGDVITPHYDPMIAKVIGHGASRDEAIARLRGALKALEMGDFVSNVPFLAKTLDHPAFAAGRTLTNFVDAHKPELLG